jgi:hypothetical protein
MGVAVIGGEAEAIRVPAAGREPAPPLTSVWAGAASRCRAERQCIRRIDSAARRGGSWHIPAQEKPP